MQNVLLKNAFIMFIYSVNEIGKFRVVWDRKICLNEFCHAFVIIVLYAK